jgi:glutamine amidotransferase
MNLIIDYGLGNLTSVYRAFNRIGVKTVVSNNPGDIKKADRIILPGVGHFKNGMEQIKNNFFQDNLNDFVKIKQKPIIGICLGMQLMTKHSEEGDIDGLGWINAETKKIESSKRIPHIGWNTLEFKNNSPLFKHNDEEAQYYFVHTYCIKNKEPKDIIATTKYGEDEFVAVFQKENIFGTQFHPEKSHEQGLEILTNFINF